MYIAFFNHLIGQLTPRHRVHMKLNQKILSNKLKHYCKKVVKF